MASHSAVTNTQLRIPHNASAINPAIATVRRVLYQLLKRFSLSQTDTRGWGGGGSEGVG
jgi:hypothetical protein